MEFPELSEPVTDEDELDELYENGEITGAEYFVYRAQLDEGPPEEGPTCSICDGLGHGYPGGGPCPLEETGEQDVPWWAQ